MYISSKDSTNGDPKVSGSQNVNTPAARLVTPKIIKGSASKVTSGKYRETCENMPNCNLPN